MTYKEIEEKTKELLAPILNEFKFDLWDVEYVKEGKDFFLRAYIDKDGGITIDDCVDVSRKLSDKLDEFDFIDDEYTLEVSSPGVERALKRDVDFEKSIGKEVYIKLYTPIELPNGGDASDNKPKGKSKAKAKDIKQKEFVGTLTNYDKETVTISLHNSETSIPTAETSTADSTENSQTAAPAITFTRKDIALIRLYAEF